MAGDPERGSFKCPVSSPMRRVMGLSRLQSSTQAKQTEQDLEGDPVPPCADVPRPSHASVQMCCGPVLPQCRHAVVQSCLSADVPWSSPASVQMCLGPVLLQCRCAMVQSCLSADMLWPSPASVQMCPGLVLTQWPASEPEAE